MTVLRRRASAIAWGYAAGKHLAPTPWKILMVLARRVNAKRDDFEVWPDQQHIAEDANLSLSTVKRHLKQLERDGYFVRRQRHAPGRGFTGWVYLLNVEADFRMPNGAVERDRFFAEEGVEPTGQMAGGRQVNRDPHRQVNGDLSNTELENRELENGEPPNPQGGCDLFPDQQLAAASMTASEMGEAFAMRWKQLASTSPKLVQDMRPGPIFLDDLQRRVRATCGGGERALVEPVLDRLFEHIAASRWLRGEGDRGWVPAPGWFVKKQNFGKVMEGFYGNDAGASADRPTRGGSYVDVARDARDAMLAGGGGARRSARDLAGFPRSGAAGARG